MKENKYYTPSLDEFYIGFRYEYYNNFSKRWIETVLEEEDYRQTETCGYINDETCPFSDVAKLRVKHLDKEDLIELGFKPTYIKEAAELIGGFDMHINEQYKILLFLTGENHIFIFRLLHCDDPSTGRWKTDLFDGKIKNKSELIKVLKMLGIK